MVFAGRNKFGTYYKNMDYYDKVKMVRSAMREKSIEEMMQETTDAIIRANGKTVYGILRNIYNSWMFTKARIRALLWSALMKRVGKNSTIMRHAWVLNPKGISIGDRVTININSILDGSGGLEIWNDVLIGPYVTILTSGHNIGERYLNISFGSNKSEPVVIKNGVWIGANATILPGVTIGAMSVIGAGAVVTKDVPPGCVYAGVPAKKIRSRK